MNDVTRSGRVKDMALAREAAFVLAGTKVHPAALEVEHAGQTKSLEPRVMKVLVALRRADGHPVSRDELIDSCWAGRVVTDAALNRCVAQLRKALAADSGIRLETIPTVGYRLQAARSDGAQIAARSSQNPGTEQPAASPDVTSDASAPSAAPGLSRRYAIAIAGLGLAVAAGAATWFIAAPRSAAWTAVSFRPLTSSPELESYPALSPDGRQIVYASAPSAVAEHDLYLRNTFQGTPVRIASDSNDNYGAAWSPSGDRIAFVRSYRNGPCALVVMPVPLGPELVVTHCQAATQTHLSWLDERTLVFADQPTATDIPRIRAVNIQTGIARDLITPPVSTFGDTGPQVSPDGHYIVFRRTLTAAADDLFMLDVGSGKTRALIKGWKEGGYVWSADSRYVFFSSKNGGEFGLWSVDRRVTRPPRRVSLLTEIFTHMSADRRNHVAVEVTRARMILSRVLPSGEFQSVTTGAGWDFDPATAPDGTIAYVSARSGAFEIWTTTPGGQATQLTSISGSYVARPTWSPHGDSIAFVAVHDRGGEIYTVLRGGAQLRQLTHDATDKRDPTYVQSGEQLLYVERKDGKWRLMQIALADPNTEPRAVPGGQGWKTLRAGPDGVILGQRDGEDTICALNTQTLTTTQMPRSADSAGSRVATSIENYSRLPNSGPHVADIDVWAVGSEGIYVRRGRRVHEPSSIWLYPWNQAGRKLADTPLAAGSIGLDASGRPIFSQALEYQIDLGLLEIADGA